ncbi:MAG TPA: hypothetical protein DCM14_01015 [Clostridiales bacterium UBA8153]|nr:hypothetical protein [Clostridiales bacterium UBA8153]
MDSGTTGFTTGGTRRSCGTRLAIGFVASHDAYCARPGDRPAIPHEATGRTAFGPGVPLAAKRLAGTAGREELLRI